MEWRGDGLRTWRKRGEEGKVEGEGEGEVVLDGLQLIGRDSLLIPRHVLAFRYRVLRPIECYES